MQRRPSPRLGLWMALALMCLLLVGCDRREMIDKVSFPEDRVLALAAIRDLERGDAAALARKMPPHVGPELVRALPPMRATLPTGRLTIEAVDGRYMERMGGGPLSRQSYLAYEVSGNGKFALVQLEIVREGPSVLLWTMQVNQLDRPAAALGAFTLGDKSFWQWLFLLLPLTMVGITIAAMIRIWRSGRFRRRILWTLGCLIGLMRLGIIWSTGELYFQPLVVQLFSASAFKPGLLAPWFISFSVPAVAIWALLRARRPAPETLPSSAAATFD